MDLTDLAYWEWAHSPEGVRALAQQARAEADAFLAATNAVFGSGDWVHWVLLESDAVRREERVAELTADRHGGG